MTARKYIIILLILFLSTLSSATLSDLKIYNDEICVVDNNCTITVEALNENNSRMNLDNLSFITNTSLVIDERIRQLENGLYENNIKFKNTNNISISILGKKDNSIINKNINIKLIENGGIIKNTMIYIKDLSYSIYLDKNFTIIVVLFIILLFAAMISIEIVRRVK